MSRRIGRGRLRNRRLIQAVAAVALALSVASCAHGAGNQPALSDPAGWPVYVGGELTRVPLSGSATSPLHWEQVGGLSPDGTAVALTLHRDLSLWLILTGHERPTRTRFDPLLAEISTGDRLQFEKREYGDLNSGGYPGIDGADNHFAVRVIAVSLPTPDSALIEYCASSSGAPDASSGPQTDSLTRIADGSVHVWLYQQTAPATPTVAFDCAAWKRSLPAGSGR